LPGICYAPGLVHPGDRDRIHKAYQAGLRGGSGNDVQFRLLRKDGGIVWVEMSWQPICDSDGNSLGHRQSIRDITARKAAERALERAEREKETILDSLAEHVVHQDVNMKVLWANRAACESAGLTRAEILGRPCYEIWAESERECRDCPVVKAMETGRPAEAEKTTPDGRTWFIQGTPVLDDERHVIGGVEITLDISAYKRTERELEELREQCHRLEERIASSQ
jgi:PAS domain S-box-containing protein